MLIRKQTAGTVLLLITLLTTDGCSAQLSSAPSDYGYESAKPVDSVQLPGDIPFAVEDSNIFSSGSGLGDEPPGEGFMRSDEVSVMLVWTGSLPSRGEIVIKPGQSFEDVIKKFNLAVVMNSGSISESSDSALSSVFVYLTRPLLPQSPLPFRTPVDGPNDGEQLWSPETVYIGEHSLEGMTAGETRQLTFESYLLNYKSEPALCGDALLVWRVDPLGTSGDIGGYKRTVAINVTVNCSEISSQTSQFVEIVPDFQSGGQKATVLVFSGGRLRKSLSYLGYPGDEWDDFFSTASSDIMAYVGRMRLLIGRERRQSKATNGDMCLYSNSISALDSSDLSDLADIFEYAIHHPGRSDNVNGDVDNQPRDGYYLQNGNEDQKSQKPPEQNPNVGVVRNRRQSPGGVNIGLRPGALISGYLPLSPSSTSTAKPSSSFSAKPFGATLNTGGQPSGSTAKPTTGGQSGSIPNGGQQSGSTPQPSTGVQSGSAPSWGQTESTPTAGQQSGSIPISPSTGVQSGSTPTGGPQGESGTTPQQASTRHFYNNLRPQGRNFSGDTGDNSGTRPTFGDCSMAGYRGGQSSSTGNWWTSMADLPFELQSVIRFLRLVAVEDARLNSTFFGRISDSKTKDELVRVAKAIAKASKNRHTFMGFFDGNAAICPGRWSMKLVAFLRDINQFLANLRFPVKDKTASSALSENDGAVAKVVCWIMQHVSSRQNSLLTLNDGVAEWNQQLGFDKIINAAILQKQMEMGGNSVMSDGSFQQQWDAQFYNSTDGTPNERKEENTSPAASTSPAGRARMKRAATEEPATPTPTTNSASTRQPNGFVTDEESHMVTPTGSAADFNGRSRQPASALSVGTVTSTQQHSDDGRDRFPSISGENGSTPPHDDQGNFINYEHTDNNADEETKKVSAYSSCCDFDMDDLLYETNSPFQMFWLERNGKIYQGIRFPWAPSTDRKINWRMVASLQCSSSCDTSDTDDWQAPDDPISDIFDDGDFDDDTATKQDNRSTKSLVKPKSATVSLLSDIHGITNELNVSFGTDQQPQQPTSAGSEIDDFETDSYNLLMSAYASNNNSGFSWQQFGMDDQNINGVNSSRSRQTGPSSGNNQNGQHMGDNSHNNNQQNGRNNQPPPRQNNQQQQQGRTNNYNVNNYGSRSSPNKYYQQGGYYGQQPPGPLGLVALTILVPTTYYIQNPYVMRNAHTSLPSTYYYAAQLPLQGLQLSLGSNMGLNRQQGGASKANAYGSHFSNQQGSQQGTFGWNIQAGGQWFEGQPSNRNEQQPQQNGGGHSSIHNGQGGAPNNLRGSESNRVSNRQQGGENNGGSHSSNQQGSQQGSIGWNIPIVQLSNYTTPQQPQQNKGGASSSVNAASRGTVVISSSSASAGNNRPSGSAWRSTGGSVLPSNSNNRPSSSSNVNNGKQSASQNNKPPSSGPLPTPGQQGKTNKPSSYSNSNSNNNNNNNRPSISFSQNNNNNNDRGQSSVFSPSQINLLINSNSNRPLSAGSSSNSQQNKPSSISVFTSSSSSGQGGTSGGSFNYFNSNSRPVSGISSSSIQSKPSSSINNVINSISSGNSRSSFSSSVSSSSSNGRSSSSSSIGAGKSSSSSAGSSSFGGSSKNTGGRARG